MNKETETRYAVPFLLWELHLYLDTHPDDAEAIAAYRQLLPDDDPETAAGAESGETRFHWVDGPWPWEFRANDMMGGE